MAKLTLTDILTAFQSTAAINANNALIETALENTVSRDGTAPNYMTADLDFNSQQLLNLRQATSTGQAVEWSQWAAGSTNVAFTGTDREIQTATAGQTLFTLAAVNYSQGTHNLAVYINGVKQTTDNYTETSSTSVTFLTGLDAGDQVEFVVNSRQVDTDLVPSTSVTHTATGTGAVQRTQSEINRDTVSVKDFGAVGDGVTDDTVAIQAAIDDFKVNGKPILMNGNFRITAPLVYQTQGNTSGLRLVGTGVYNSSIIGDFTGTNLIEIDGSSLEKNRFQYGGGFSDIRLTTAVGASIEHGIRVNGWWYANHTNLQIGELNSPTFTKNGIYIQLRADIDANPDYYASVQWVLDGVIIDSMGEYGIYGENSAGYAGWVITGGGFNRNGIDGLYVNTNGWRVKNCAAAYNGRYGINYSGSTGFTLSNGYFSQIEVDGNATAGLRIARVNSGIFQNLRFISRVLDGSETQLVHVLSTNTQVCNSIELKNSYHRIETGVTSPVTLYDFSTPSANVSGNRIEGYRLLNTAGVTVTEASTSLLDRRYKNFVQDRNGVQKTASPTKFAHASYSSQAITNTLSTWIFDETVSSTGWTDYNTTTGELTVPHNGFYSFFVTFICSNVPAGEQFIVNLIKNGSIYKTWYWDWPAGVGADRWSFDGVDLVDAVGGDVIKIEVKNTTGTATLYDRAKLSISCA